MPKHVLTVAGLIVEALGVVIIFVWGPPMPDFQEYVGLSVKPATRLPDGRTAREHADEARKRRQSTR
jgi:hypothetical protein